MTVYYYDPVSGSNAANGLTPGTARQTLGFANSNHAAGDTIAIRNDRLFTENNAFVPAGNNVIYTSYDPDTGALYTRGMNRPTHRPTSNRNIQDGGAIRTGIQIKGLIFDQVTGSQQNVTFTAASTDCLMEDVDLINCPDYPCQWNHTDAHRITIRRCYFNRIGESCMVLYGDDCLIENCVLSDFGYINATGAHGIYTKGARAVIRDNVLMGFSPANSGITFRRTNSVVVRNLIMNSTTGAAAIDWYWEEQDTNTEGVSVIAHNRIFNVGVGMYAGPPNSNIALNQTVTGAVTAGGLIRLTVTSHGRSTGDKVFVQNVGGVPNATGYWTVTNSGANTLDLQGSTFAGTYTSGGTLQRVTRDKFVIFNNTIDCNSLTGGNTGQAFDFSDTFTSVCSIAFYNNVIMNCTSRYVRFGTISATAGNTWMMDYNTYYPGTGSLYAYGGFLDNFATYQGRATVLENNSNNTNPAFAKNGPDFTPSASSATVDSGTTSIDASVTLVPNTRTADNHLGYTGSAPDKGAVEWEPTTIALRDPSPDANIYLVSIVDLGTVTIGTSLAPGTATIVQTKTGKVDAGAAGVDLPLTLDNPSVSGRAIVVSVSGWNTGNGTVTFTCTDNKGNTYSTPASAAAETPGHAWVQQFYCPNIVGGASHVVTVDSNVANYIQAEVMEVSGIKTSSPLDGSVENAIQGFAGTSTTGTLAYTGDAFLVAAMTEDGGFTVTGTSNSFVESYDGNTGQPVHTAYRSVTGAGSTSCTFTMSGSQGSAAVAMALVVPVVGSVVESVVTGDLTVTAGAVVHQLVGSAVGASSVGAPVLQVARPLAGSVVGASSLALGATAPTVVHTLAGSIVGGSALTLAVTAPTVVHTLAGAVTGASALGAAELGVLHTLAGTIGGVGVTGAPVLSVARPLAGTVSGASSLVVTGISNIVQLAASVVGDSSLTAVAPAVLHTIAGTIGGASALTVAAPTAAYALAGSIVGASSSGAAVLSVLHTLAGTVTGGSSLSSAVAQPAVAHTLAGIALGDGVLTVAAPAVLHTLTGTIGGAAVVGAPVLAVARPLSGTTTGSSSLGSAVASVQHLLTGTITGAGALTGTFVPGNVQQLAGIALGDGVLSVAAPGVSRTISATIAGTTVVSGNLALGAGLSGAALGSGLLSGGMTVAWYLGGQATGAGALTGAARLAIPLAASVVGAGNVGAALNSPAIQLAASAAGVAVLSGSVNVAHLLAGTVAAGSSVTALLGAIQPVAAGSTGSAVLAGGLRFGWALSASPQGVGVMSATLSRTTQLAASAAGSTLVLASLDASSGMFTNPAGSSSVTAALGVARPLAGSAAGGSVVGSPVLRLGLPLSGSVSGLGGLSGALGLRAALAAAVFGTGSLQGTLASSSGMTANPAGQGTLVASLGLALPIAAAANGLGGLSGGLRVAVALQGSVGSATAATGALGVRKGLGGAIAGSSVLGSPELVVGGAFAGLSTGRAVVSGDLSVEYALGAAAAGTSAVTFGMEVVHFLTVDVGPGVLAPPPPWSPGGWAPTSLTGLGAWLDAAQLGLADGAAVTSWPDLSGQGRHMAASGSPPVCRTDVLNRLPVVRFDGIDDLLTSVGVGTYQHFFVVARFNGATFPTYNGLLTGITGNEIFFIGEAGSALWYPPIGTHESRRDGALNPGRTAPMGVWDQFGLSYATPWPGSRLQLGRDREHAPRWWDGDVAEVIAFDRVLTGAERVQVEDYLRAKWLVAPVPDTPIGSTLTGGLAVHHPLSVAISASSRLEGSTDLRWRLAGTISGAASVSASLPVARPLAGSWVGSSSLAGALTRDQKLAGIALGTGQMTAGLRLLVSLSGSTAGRGRMAYNDMGVVIAGSSSLAGELSRASAAGLGGKSVTAGSGHQGVTMEPEDDPVTVGMSTTAIVIEPEDDAVLVGPGADPVVMEP